MLHKALKDASISVVAAYYDNEEGHNPHCIELDCPPGSLRPWDLLPQVIENTGLVFDDPKAVGAFFGFSAFYFPDTTCEEWIRVQPILEERITSLYNHGAIRYGSW